MCFVMQTSLARVGWPWCAAHCVQHDQHLLVLMTKEICRCQDSCAGTYWQQQEQPAHFPSAAGGSVDGWDSSICVTRDRRQSLCPGHACVAIIPSDVSFAGPALFSFKPNPFELFLRCLCPVQTEVLHALSLSALAFQCGTRSGRSWTRTSIAPMPCGCSTGWRSPRGRSG